MKTLAFLVAYFTAMCIDMSLALAPILGAAPTSIATVATSMNELTNPSIDGSIDFGKDFALLQRRREFCILFAGGVYGLLMSSTPAAAAPIEEGTMFRRETGDFRYEFQPPPGFIGPGQKPLKTHLDEVNFHSSDVSGFQIGITVDPVRISSLAEFGTAEQVAAKVVLAEVNRDGVLDVKLLEDPISDEIHIDGASMALFYQLNYLSSGKRGNKRNIAKFFVKNRKLFALTAQCKEENFDTVQGAMLSAVRSFRVL